MKKTYFILLTILSFQSFAQTEGVIHYNRTTYWSKLISTLSYLSKQEKERSAYMWGGRDDWKQLTVLYFNEKGSHYTNSDEKTEESEGWSGRKEAYNIHRDFEKNTQTDIIEMIGKTYIVEDSLQLLNWKILNDLKDIAGHICMKASVEDTVKKQKIIAWFAQDIPLNIGPERYCGLPGAILELIINDGAVVIVADRIENKKLTQELDLPKKMKGKKVKEVEYQDIIRKFIAEKIKAEQNPYWSLRY
jgi:GLPGLI family protein